MTMASPYRYRSPGHRQNNQSDYRREDFSGFRSGGIQESERNRAAVPGTPSILALPSYSTTPLAFAHQLR